MRKTPTLLDYLISGMIFLALLFFAAYICWKVVVYGLDFISPGIVWSAELSDKSDKEDALLEFTWTVAQENYDYLLECEGKVEKICAGQDITEFWNLDAWGHLTIDCLCRDLALYRQCPSHEHLANIATDLITLSNIIEDIGTFMWRFEKEV